MTIPVFVHQLILYFSASLSLFGNGLLLQLLTHRCSHTLGNYRILLASFASMDILLSSFHAWYIPMFILGDRGFVYYGYGALLGKSVIEVNANVIYSSTFYLPLLLISLHFIYRYLSLKRPRFVKEHFSRFMIFCLFYSAAYTLSVACLAYAMCNMGVPERFYDYLSDYGIRRWRPVMNVAAIEYITADSEYNMRAIIIILGGAAVGGLSVVVSIVCIWKILGSINDSALAIRVRRMHIQLFRSLLLQFAVPCVFSFLPFTLIVLLPITGFPLGQTGNVCALFVSLFPAIDPILIIVSISRFRSTLLEWKDMVTGRKGARNEEMAVERSKSFILFVRPKATQTV